MGLHWAGPCSADTPMCGCGLTSGCATTVGLHALPEEGVVPHLGGVVENCGGLALVPGGEHDVLEALLLHLRPSDGLVHVVQVGAVMLAPVEPA